jgi:Fe-S-cluster containining protein
MRPPTDELMPQLIARAADAALVAAVDAVYSELADAIASRGPVCEMSGHCCNFAQWDHRLYVTSPEVVHFVAGWRWKLSADQRARLWARMCQANSDGSAPLAVCPLQTGRICGAHGIRPMGCRLFFCEPGAERWGRPLYESLHARLKSFCETYSLPYAYVEWTQVLCALAGRESLNPAHAKGYRESP